MKTSRIEYNIITGEQTEVELTPEEIAALQAAFPTPSPADQIKQLEAASGVPRITREFMLGVMEKEAIDTGITIEQLAVSNIGYKKLKDLDNQIKALRKLI